MCLIIPLVTRYHKINTSTSSSSILIAILNRISAMPRGTFIPANTSIRVSQLNLLAMTKCW